MTADATPSPGSPAAPPAPARAGSRRLWSSALGVLAAAALAIGANLLAERAFPRARIDLTEQRLYSLSDGTRQVLAGLKDPVTLRLFYSRRLGAEAPTYGAYADRVRAMLREYASLSGGRIRLEILDPEPFSETEDRALGYGLQGVPIDQTGEQVYFGLVGTNLVDDERTIRFFQPERERFLEYDLTKLVWELSNPERPVVGVMSSLPLDGDMRLMAMRPGPGGPGQPAVVMEQLRQFFTVKMQPLDAQVIDPDVKLLVVAQAQNLPEATQYAIDQFVMRGGALLVMVDPHSEAQAARPNPGGAGAPRETWSQLDRLLNAWGVEAPRDRVVLDQRGAWRVRAGPGERVQAVDYLAWYNLQGDSLNRDEVTTAQLDQVTVASAGEVRRREGAGGELEFIPLLTTSAQSMLVDVERVRVEPNPVRLLADFRPDGQRRVLMARLRGRLASAFPDGPPPPPEGRERPDDFPAHRAATDAPANLIVANDSDILEDRFWVRVQDFFGQQVTTPFSGNGALVLNIADSLTGSDALVSLRSRGESLRPFVLVEAIRREAEAEFRQTERALQQRLEETERRLRELRQGGTAGGTAGGAAAGAPRAGAAAGGDSTLITQEQRAEIDAAQREILRTRQELRGVQLALRRDIEGLESRLRLANIALVPLVLAVLAILLAVLRARRRAAARS